VTRLRWNVLLLTVLFVGVAWILVNRMPADDRERRRIAPGAHRRHPAPDFTASTLTGEQFTLSELRRRWC
jgi:hypothetical protein